MGKIKSKLIRRTAKELLRRGISFKDSFGDNKAILGMTMPSKKIRNQIAGLLAVIKKREKLQESKLQESLKQKNLSEVKKF